MKKILFLTLVAFLSVVAKAQTDIETMAKQLVKEDNEAAFKVDTVPAAFNNESVVRLAEKNKLIFEYNKMFGFKISHYLHSKTKITDLNALMNYSQFTLDMPSENNYVAINIIKPNKKVIAVSLDDAIKNDVRVNTKKLSLNIGDGEGKLAIKNLEIGDIIEYISLTKSNKLSYTTTHYLKQDMPCVWTKFEITYNNSMWYSAANSYFDAPKFKKKVDKKGNVNLTLEASMIEKYKDELESVDATLEPHFKLEVFYNKFSTAAQYKKDAPLTKFTNQDLINGVYNLCSNKSLSSSSDYLAYIKKHGYAQSDKDFIIGYYYFLRDKAYLESYVFDGEPGYYAMRLMRLLIRSAQKRDINFDIIRYADYETGLLENVLFEEELNWGVNFKFKGSDLTINAFGIFSHPTDISTDYQGTYAYRFSNVHSKSKMKVEKFLVPYQPAEINKAEYVIKAKFQNGFDSVLVERNTALTGSFKSGIGLDLTNQYDYFMKYQQMLKESKYFKDTNPNFYFLSSYVYSNMNFTFCKNEESRLKHLYLTNQNKRIKNNLIERNEDEDYEMLRFLDYRILSNSSHPDSNFVGFTEKLIAGDVGHENRNFLVVDIGKLLGGFYQINGERSRNIRTKPFYTESNRQIKSVVEFEIPKGYTVGNLSQLNQQLENKVGTVTVGLSKDGANIKMEVVKTYKAGTYESKDWAEFIQFLDAAAATNQYKIILTKN